jgi:formate hydrogenlyase subunit 4
LTARLLVLAQLLGYVAGAPLTAGVVQWLEARLQGRRGAGPAQPYRDLCKLLRKRPTVPASASTVYRVAPSVAFTCVLLLGFALPYAYVPAGPGMDLLLVVGLLSLAKFVTILAAFDAGSPLVPLSGGRQWFIHVLAEPALLVTIYVFAITGSTTNLPLLARAGSSPVTRQPTVLLAIGAILVVLLAETGRLPFDQPGSHLELTMIEEGVLLEYSGRALALMWWAHAMMLTFALSLVVFLVFPPGAADGASLWRLSVLLGAFVAKLAALLVLLAIWETARSKVRLKTILTPLLLATGVLLFTVATLVVTFIKRGT